jgi:hypothetical protein
MAAMFVVIMFDARTGQEGMAAIRKDAYELMTNPVTKVNFYHKTRGELSKNHQNAKVYHKCLGKLSLILNC